MQLLMTKSFIYEKDHHFVVDADIFTEWKCLVEGIFLSQPFNLYFDDWGKKNLVAMQTSGHFLSMLFLITITVIPIYFESVVDAEFLVLFQEFADMSHRLLIGRKSD